MRARNRRGLKQRVSNCSAVQIKEPTLHKGKWHEVFSNSNPIHLELGCGKGKFITEMAILHPNINFIAMERVENIIVLAMEKALEQNIPNIRFLQIDAHELLDIFEEGEIDRIYLNFSDPWPKTKHAKRRLTSEVFLPIYRKVLSKDGCIWQKTDNRALFDYSLESFKEGGYALDHVSFDLHHSDFTGNVMTEYEINFSSKGFPIHRLEATPIR